MRIIISVILLFCAMEVTLAQTPADKTVKPAKAEIPSKAQMNTQMQKVIQEVRDQIADLERQLAAADDPETKKELQDQITALKKQLELMGGVSAGIRNMSGQTFQKASEEHTERPVPAKDVRRISTIPKKILSDAELITHLKTVFTDVESMIPASEKTAAGKIYTETKTQYKSANALNSAASGCWMYGHQGKALWITGKACIDYQADPDLLDNYAAFLIMTGAEQHAIPILSYLDNKYPNNSTILNNLGQAWFGLGDVANSKRYLEKATELYPTHSMANLTLSKIFLGEDPPNTAKAMDALKTSISESYSGDKEGMVEAIGGALTTDDLPDFNYPVEKDPFHFDGFFQVIPDNQGSLDEYADSKATWDGFDNTMKEASEKAKIQRDEANKEIHEFIDKMTQDIPYQRKILYTYHNSPAHLLAKRYLLAIAVDDASGASIQTVKSSPFPLSLTMPSNFSPRGQKKPISLLRVLKILDKFTEDELIKPAEQLEVDRMNRIKSIRTEDEVVKCQQVDAINNDFLSGAKALQTNFKTRFYQKYLELQHPFDLYMAIAGYGDQTKTVAEPDPAEDVTRYFVNVVQPNITSQIGKPPYIHRVLFSAFLDSWNKLVSHRVTADHCSRSSEEKPATPIQLPRTKKPDCPNKATFNLCVIKVAFEWGRMFFDESKLKKLSSGETKGSAISSNHPPSNAPVSLDAILNGRGPSRNNSGLSEDALFNGPLVTGIPDATDITQRYVEFDKFGNFSDLKIPLNEDGTGFADMQSPERFDQRRWCWIACPSGREKILSGVSKKP